MDRKLKIKKLRLQGLTFKKIGKIFNISDHRAHQIFSGYKPGTKKWKDIREKVFFRDNYQCQLRGTFFNECSKKLIVHHFDGNDRNNNLDNLITLCNKCHGGFHGFDRIRIVKLKLYICKYCGKKFNKNGLKSRGNPVCYECDKNIWSRKYKLFACKNCKSSKSAHFKKGLCFKCYKIKNEDYKNRNKIMKFSPIKPGIRVKINTQFLFNIFSEEYGENSVKWIELYHFLKKRIPEEKIIKYL